MLHVKCQKYFSGTEGAGVGGDYLKSWKTKNTAVAEITNHTAAPNFSPIKSEPVRD